MSSTTSPWRGVEYCEYIVINPDIVGGVLALLEISVLRCRSISASPSNSTQKLNLKLIYDLIIRIAYRLSCLRCS